MPYRWFEMSSECPDCSVIGPGRAVVCGCGHVDCEVMDLDTAVFGPIPDEVLPPEAR